MTTWLNTSKLKSYLQLTRPANLITAVADILAGMVIAQFLFSEYAPYWLVLSTLGLYGGGVVLNDVFDARLDAVERPERPIPGGRVPFRSAAIFGAVLLISGVVFAALLSSLSGRIALVVALLTLVYNRWAKHSVVAGPLVMGLCRGGNLLLGMSVVPLSLHSWWPLSLIPVTYISAITLVSQGEVHGGNRKSLYLAAVLYGLVHAAQLAVAFDQGNGWIALPFVLAHAWMIGIPLWKAVENPVGPLIGKAVKAGVISLIVMNAAWCVAFGYWPVAILVVLLLPLSIFLGKLFAVT